MSEETEVIEVDPAAATETAAPPESATATEEDVEAKPATKTFTQAELNEIVQKEKIRAERKAARAYREGVERAIPQQQAQPSNTMPSRDAYASDEDWLDARDAHRDAQRDARQMAERQQANQASFAKTTERLYSDAAKIPGFDRDSFDDLPLTHVLVEALIESDIAPKLMHYMASHPDDVERISALGPARQAVELGKIEARLSAAPVKTSNAPAPISPIGGTRGANTKDPATMTDAEYAAWRHKQIAQRR